MLLLEVGRFISILSRENLDKQISEVLELGQATIGVKKKIWTNEISKVRELELATIRDGRVITRTRAIFCFMLL